MLLSLMNHLNRADRQVRHGTWVREGNRGTEIKGKTVGIIGYGNMGSAFAQRLKGFEARVISFDKYKRHYSDGNTTETSLEEIFEQADILSLHVPLTEETTHMVDDDFLGRFQKNIWLINTARGQVVNTADLVKNLVSGRVIGAALDVMEYEDASFESLSGKVPDDLNYLLQAENVILTPHIAGWTHESNVKLARELVGYECVVESRRELERHPGAVGWGRELGGFECDVKGWRELERDAGAFGWGRELGRSGGSLEGGCELERFECDVESGGELAGHGRAVESWRELE
jgi:phosphoglycerate dehydrogenase-like enzyme